MGGTLPGLPDGGELRVVLDRDVAVDDVPELVRQVEARPVTARERRSPSFLRRSTTPLWCTTPMDATVTARTSEGPRPDRSNRPVTDARTAATRSARRASWRTGVCALATTVPTRSQIAPATLSSPMSIAMAWMIPGLNV